MFTLETWLTYTFACLVLAVSPGPGNILAIGKGLSQGKVAALIIGVSSGLGILFHVAAATFGLTLLIQSSELAFTAVRIIGAAYLIWLGIKVILTRKLFEIKAQEKQPLKTIFATGFFAAALNPRAGIFVLAFIPQFVNAGMGSVTTQMLVYGLWFALLSVVIITIMGVFASTLSHWLQEKPKFIFGLNIGAGLTFLASGFSIANMKQ